MRKFLLSHTDEGWQLTDKTSNKTLACFDTKLDAIRQSIYKLKHCPDGGTLVIEKKDGEIQEEKVFSPQ